MTTDTLRSALDAGWRVAEDLDSNHARFVVTRIADLVGEEFDWHYRSEPNNVLREQLRDCQEQLQAVPVVLEAAAPPASDTHDARAEPVARLTKYGQHLDECPRSLHRSDGEICTCGWSELRAALTSGSAEQ